MKRRKRLFKKKYFFITPILIFVLLVSAVLPTHAFIRAGWLLYGKSSSYTWGDRLQGESARKTTWQTAMGDWTVASSTRFGYVTTSVNTFNTMYEKSTSLYGETTITHSGGYVTKFDANLNMGHSDISMYDTVARSTANHEIGHILGLADQTVVTCIMDVTRDRKVVLVPQPDDKRGIRIMYGEQ